MANYTGLITGLVTSVKQRITTKNTTDSIDPVDVGGSITDLAETLLPVLNSINEFNILGGASSPTQGLGNEDDVYIQYGTSLVFWKKDNNAWASKVTANLGINIPDGNLNLQYRIAGMVVTVSSGIWYIDNTQYQKAVQTQFTVPVADLNLDRIDAIFADKNSEIHYVAGTESANPDNTKPVTPNDEIIVTYIYIPKSSSNQLPYIADSNFADNGFPFATSGANEPTSGIDGDLYFQIPVDNSYLKLWQKLSGSWQSVFDLSLTPSTPVNTDIRRVFVIPSSEIDDNGEVNLTGRTNEQGDTIIPSDAVVSIYNPRWGGQQYDPSTGIVSGLDPAFDVKVVLIGGENEPIPEPPYSVGFDNFYTGNAEESVFNILLTAPNGNTVYFDVLTESSGIKVLELNGEMTGSISVTINNNTTGHFDYTDGGVYIGDLDNNSTISISDFPYGFSIRANN